jgi:hypothetical protein
MKQKLLEIYALCTCLLAVLVISTTFILLTWNAVKLNAPSFTLSSRDFKCHQNDQEYKICLSYRWYYPHEDSSPPLPSDQELAGLREKSYETLIAVEHRDAQQGLVLCSIILFMGLLIFATHWWLAKRARN